MTVMAGAICLLPIVESVPAPTTRMAPRHHAEAGAIRPHPLRHRPRRLPPAEGAAMEEVARTAMARASGAPRPRVPAREAVAGTIAAAEGILVCFFLDDAHRVEVNTG